MNETPCARCGSTTSDRIYEFTRATPDGYGVSLKAVVVCADPALCGRRQRAPTE